MEGFFGGLRRSSRPDITCTDFGWLFAAAKSVLEKNQHLLDPPKKSKGNCYIPTKKNTACVHVLVMLLVPKQQQNTRWCKDSDKILSKTAPLKFLKLRLPTTFGQFVSKVTASFSHKTQVALILVPLLDFWEVWNLLCICSKVTTIYHDF